jgi:hypothetical protein
MHIQRRRILVAGLALSVLWACACGSAYKRPITGFNDASAVVIATSRVYFSELNRVERDALIEKLSAERKSIDLLMLRKAQPFSEKQIQERLDALDALARYGGLLAKLESSDAPAQIQTEFNGLADSLKALEKTVSGDDSSKKFQAAVGPVASLIGAIASIGIRAKIDQQLKTAIVDGDKHVQALLTVMEDDLSDAFQNRRLALSQLRTFATDAYNEEITKGKSANPDVLIRLASRIKTVEDQWESFQSTSPIPSLKAMGKAHKALVAYAVGPKTPATFAAVLDEVEAFLNEARRVGEAVQALRAV